MRKLILIVAFLFFMSAGSSFIVEAGSINDSVVKIFVTTNRMDFYYPWQSKGSASQTGSGCILEGNKIITNAHVVSDHTFIQVRKESDPKKYTAHVEAIGEDCDLALLTVADQAFFDGTEPVDIGELVSLQDNVTVIGYPLGGDKLSITEGVVSRIEITPYAQSSRKLLAVQIDAAINPGNSGGPVIKDNKIVGVAMQAISKSQNIGYMIPTPVIRHFFDDLSDNNYDGFPHLGIEVNTTENTALREYFQVSDKEGGVVVTWVYPNSSAEGFLEEGDVILAIDSIPIGVDGTFVFRKNERLILTHLINEKQVGDSVAVEVSRQGKNKKLQVPIKKYVPLIPYPNFYSKPTYYIYAGLVFTPLSTDLLKTWGKRWWERSPVDFLSYLVGSSRLNLEKDKEIVVLLQVLPDDINIGYHQIAEEVIKEVNGEKISSFQEFVTKLENISDPYAVITTQQNAKLIIDTTRAKIADNDILKRNNIPRRFSEDIAEWIKK